MTAPGSAEPAGFDFDRPWALDDHVALRPERFGALAYHFHTRRLSLLKDRTLIDVLRSLDGHGSAREACLAAGVGSERLGSFAQALATLARSGMIRERSAG